MVYPGMLSEDFFTRWRFEKRSSGRRVNPETGKGDVGVAEPECKGWWCASLEAKEEKGRAEGGFLLRGGKVIG